MFIDAYLALCSAVSPGAATELMVPGYARQPIGFNDPVDGVTVSAVPYAFGMTVRGAVGRAIYDAPTGGNLLLVCPFATPRPILREMVRRMAEAVNHPDTATVSEPF